MKTYKTEIEAREALKSLSGRIFERSRLWDADVVELLFNEGYCIEILTPKRRRYNMDPIEYDGN